MIHYSLNTGHAVHSPRSGVGDDAIEALRELALRGGVIPGFAPFRVTVDHGDGSATKPKTLSWLAVVLLPSLLNQRRDDIGWLGDFERCMAWTIIADNTGSR